MCFLLKPSLRGTEETLELKIRTEMGNQMDAGFELVRFTATELETIYVIGKEMYLENIHKDINNLCCSKYQRYVA